MEHFINGFKNYANFSGRERRQAYWMFVLFYMIFFIITRIIDVVLGTIGVINVIFLLVCLLPNLGYTVRRLHDTGRTGWFILIGIIPLIGSLILIYFLCQDSVEDNEYGSNPKK